MLVFLLICDEFILALMLYARISGGNLVPWFLSSSWRVWDSIAWWLVYMLCFFGCGMAMAQLRTVRPTWRHVAANSIAGVAVVAAMLGLAVALDPAAVDKAIRIEYPQPCAFLATLSAILIGTNARRLKKARLTLTAQREAQEAVDRTRREADRRTLDYLESRGYVRPSGTWVASVRSLYASAGSAALGYELWAHRGSRTVALIPYEERLLIELTYIFIIPLSLLGYGFFVNRGRSLLDLLVRTSCVLSAGVVAASVMLA